MIRVFSSQSELPPVHTQCLCPHKQGGQGLLSAHWLHFNGACSSECFLSKQRGWKALYYSSCNRISFATFSVSPLSFSTLSHFICAAGSFFRFGLFLGCNCCYNFSLCFCCCCICMGFYIMLYEISSKFQWNNSSCASHDETKWVTNGLQRRCTTKSSWTKFIVFPLQHFIASAYFKKHALFLYPVLWSCALSYMFTQPWLCVSHIKKMPVSYT